MPRKRPRGVGFALLAALLFGLSTPLAKPLLTGVSSVLLAGLLYLGSGLGLSILWSVRRLMGTQGPALTASDIPWLGGAVLFGGIAGPVLLMVGLGTTPAST